MILEGTEKLRFSQTFLWIVILANQWLCLLNKHHTLLKQANLIIENTEFPCNIFIKFWSGYVTVVTTYIFIIVLFTVLNQKKKMYGSSYPGYLWGYICSASKVSKRGVFSDPYSIHYEHFFGHFLRSVMRMVLFFIKLMNKFTRMNETISQWY